MTNRTSNIIPLHTARPFPWELYTVVAPPATRIQRRRERVRWVFAIAAVLIVIGCGLAGLSHP